MIVILFVPLEDVVGVIEMYPEGTPPTPAANFTAVIAPSTILAVVTFASAILAVVTASSTILAVVTASLTILAVVTVLSLGVPMLLTEIAATIISIAVVLGGGVENVTTAGSAALTE